MCLQAKEAAQLVVVLWKSGGATQLDLARAAENRRETVFVEAPISPGTDSSILADRLGVRTFPCVQAIHCKRRSLPAFMICELGFEFESLSFPPICSMRCLACICVLLCATL